MGMVILLSILRYCFESINLSPHINHPFYARLAYSLWMFLMIVEVPGMMLLI